MVGPCLVKAWKWNKFFTRVVSNRVYNLNSWILNVHLQFSVLVMEIFLVLLKIADDVILFSHAVVCRGKESLITSNGGQRMQDLSGIKNISNRLLECFSFCAVRKVLTLRSNYFLTSVSVLAISFHPHPHYACFFLLTLTTTIWKFSAARKVA